MTWYEIGLIILAAGLIIPVVAVFVRHFPQIAVIEVDDLPETKQQQVKVVMAEQRLYRKFKRFRGATQQVTKPLFSIVRSVVLKWRERLLELERKYKLESLQVKSATESGKESIKQKIALELKQARDATARDDFDVAESHYLHVIQIDPMSVDAFEGLGDIYVVQKKYDEAEEVYLYLLKLLQDQDAPQVHLSALAEHDKPEEQRHVVAIELGKIHFLLSEVYTRQELLEKAEKELNKALSKESNNPKYLDALLDICIMKKDKIRAQEVFFKLKETNPDNKKLAAWEEQINSL